MLNTDNINKNEIFEYIKDVSFEIEKIISINKYLTKANFITKAKSVEIDIVKFINEYISAIYETNTSKDLSINIIDNSLEYIYKFEPIKINVIMDNLLINSKKANARNVQIKFLKDEDLILEYIDDGEGLDQSISDPNYIFEMGFTTTNGSGLGLYHIKEILKEMNNSTIYVDRLEQGIKFTIRFKR
jgi:signal transduction histidine kinase